MFARALQFLMNGVALATAATISLAHPTRAQLHRRLEIAPALGAYMPTGGRLFVEFGCIKSSPVPCEVPALKQTRAVAVGGRAAVWLGTRGAVEGSLWYAPSGINDTTRYTTAVNYGYGADGKIVLVSLRGVLNLAIPATTVSVLLMGGPAVLHRFGDAWANWSGSTSGAGMLGIGVELHAGHGFGVRAAIEGYLYRFDAQRAEVSESAFHHDLVFSLSMGPSRVLKNQK